MAMSRDKGQGTRDKEINNIRVRLAPSPTGPLHIGTARTALFNWLFARKNGGKFIVRIEDTDKERSEKKYEDEILEGLKWLGLDWDEEIYRQSERTEIYKKYLEQMLAKGDAYYCYCSKEDLEAERQTLLAQGLPPKYNGHCRPGTRDKGQGTRDKKPEVIRFKVPEMKVEFHDLIRNKVVFDAALFGDIVIARLRQGSGEQAKGLIFEPLYNFAVVVDDELMEISHVIRGEDHLSNTPKQILMQRALGFREPIYAHIPLILNPDRSKMSKRFTDTALSEYRARGYVPDAIVNFLALMGWHPKDNREVLPREELIKTFDLGRVQKSGAVFNQEKLDWLNREYLKMMGDEEISKIIRDMDNGASVTGKSMSHVPLAIIRKIVAVERGRANTLNDFVELGKFFFELPDYEAPLLVWRNGSASDIVPILEDLRKKLSAISAESFNNREILASTIQESINGKNRGEVLWPLRVALSGQQSSPDPLDIMMVLGKEESLRRIGVAAGKMDAEYRISNKL
jgi:glutamyl-tRNA synthetase